MDNSLNEVGFTPLDNENNEDDDEELELIDAITADDEDLEEADVDLTDVLLTSEDEELKDVIDSDYAIDVAIALEDFEDDELMTFYNRLDKESTAQLLEQMDEDLQQRFVSMLDINELISIFKYMSNDDIADIIGEMPVNRRKNILKKLKSKDSIEVATLLLYDDDTAGGLMTTEYIALSRNLTVEKALMKIKQIGPKTEIIDTIFVLGDRKELVGTADLRDILIEDNNVLLGDIMYDNIVTVTPEMDQEEVSHIASKYDLTAVPVVNRRGSLLGIITVDDIIDVLVEEQTEDILKMSGTSSEEEIDTPIKESVHFRLPWLMVNLCTAFLASFTLSMFEETISQVVALSAIMTIVASMGGNSGNQTMAIILRGITLGKINLKDDWRLFVKPIIVGIINGSIIGFIASIIIFFRYHNIFLSIIMIMAMIINNIVAGFFGFFVPLVLKHFNIDPALASSIFLTAATDVLGFFVFLSLAKLFLPLLV